MTTRDHEADLTSRMQAGKHAPSGSHFQDLLLGARTNHGGRPPSLPGSSRCAIVVLGVVVVAMVMAAAGWKVIFSNSDLSFVLRAQSVALLN